MDAVDHTEFAELLAVYSLDALPPDEVSELESHLADCPRCRAELESLAGRGGPARQLRRERPCTDLGPYSQRARPPTSRPTQSLCSPSKAASAPPYGATPPSLRLRWSWWSSGCSATGSSTSTTGSASCRRPSGERGVGQLVTLAIENPASHDVELTAKTSLGASTCRSPARWHCLLG